MTTATTKRDPYYHKERWENFLKRVKKNGGKIKGISEHNSNIIMTYLRDMELGMNIDKTARRGGRSPNRLNTIHEKMVFFAKKFDKNLDELTREEAHSFFNDMEKGRITRKDGKPYIGIGNFSKDFKAFFNWLYRTKRIDENIGTDLSRDDRKPNWVYLTEEQFKLMAEHAKPKYRALMWFMYDSGIRVTEANSVQVRDFENDFGLLHIREENSKTFGRKIKLMLCKQYIKEFIKYYGLKDDDYLFIMKPSTFNKYLKDLAKRLFGDELTKGRERYSKFTLYDIRHNSACYWLPRYKTNGAMMYRFGWKKEQMIHYYSEFFGNQDTISEEDMLISEDKVKVVRELEEERRARLMLEESQKDLENNFKKLVKYLSVVLNQETSKGIKLGLDTPRIIQFKEDGVYEP